MRDKLSNVQALRGVACLAVVLYHAAALEVVFRPSVAALRPCLGFGYAGVDLFFVISGFVMAYAHRDGFGRPGLAPRFVLRRLWRVYPTYWVALGGICGFVWVLVMWPPGSCEWVRDAALLPEPNRWVPQAWTLSYELAFYLAFAALLPLPRRVALAALLAWAAGLAAVGIAGAWPSGRGVELWCSPPVAEFLAGAMVGWVVSERASRWAVPMLAAAGVWGGVALALVARAGSDPTADWPVRAATWAVPCALLVAAAAATDLGRGWRAPRWVGAVGEASYSIYLVHWCVLVAVTAAWTRRGYGQHPASYAAWAGVTIAAAVGVGVLLHRYVEKPLLGLAAGRKRAETTPPAAPAAAPERRAA
jgi:peptidoglycan/LPS O-acetylase OafA/YrhL